MIEKYQGIHKVTEEAGELLQVLGKLNDSPNDDPRFGKKSLRIRLSEELTDLEAALAYFREMSDLPRDKDRYGKKLNKHHKRGLPGVRVDETPEG